ncbi:MAG: hypothetical protein IOB85_15205 [Methylobacterium sp.]|nr:hypothetical protein [Methylobacterium sp.]MCA3665855.1 hypothetical protein [Methylobacterium sp.]MCA3668145.1 hypothetical protein [Methylobacterium sp.]MCA3674759.1 hypothetical protein [Methylobacterium sp.]MCA3678133.1 hypothetical protein [Methylobacterium sp.]
MSGLSYYAQFFAAVFRSRRTHELAAQYRSIGENKLLLADILSRAGVFDPVPRPGNPQSLAFQEGRRSLALEILHLSQAEPMEIEAFLKTTIRTQPRKETSP